VGVTNSLALSYQWFFNATNAISDITTNPGCRLPSVQWSHSGAYSVVVSNVFGWVTSAPAMLSVITPVARRPVPGIRLVGTAGMVLDMLYAETLGAATSWASLESVTLASPSQYYFDLTVPLPSQRYYRAGYLAKPLVPPMMDLHMVPAITLTGNVASSVRVDSINRIGPIDAWVTLDTVTLTNASQRYFDISAPGQPERLYRLVPLP